MTGNPEEHMFEQKEEDDSVWQFLASLLTSLIANDLDVGDEDDVAVKDQLVYLEKVQNRIKTVSLPAFLS